MVYQQTNKPSSSAMNKPIEIPVPPGTMIITENAFEVYKAVNLAASVMLVAFHPKPELAVGMIHMMMPESQIAKAMDNPNKYVDTGLPAFLAEWQRKGYSLDNTTFCLVGGAQLFNFAGEASNMLNVGLRNTILTQSIMTKAEAKIYVKETGGNRPRALSVQVWPFKVQVSVPRAPGYKTLIGE